MDGRGIQNVSRKILSLIGQDLFQFQGRIQKVVFPYQECGEKLKKEERNVGELHEDRDFKGERYFRCNAIFQGYFVIKNDFLNTSSKTLK